MLAALVLLAVAAQCVALEREKDRQAAYDECLLEYLKGTRLDVASHLITTACRELHLDTSPSVTDRGAYNICILEHVPGTESAVAVLELREACRRRHLD
ncbi:MAG: VF_A0006 family four-cysteine protein [Pseudomonadales bacterium]